MKKADKALPVRPAGRAVVKGPVARKPVAKKTVVKVVPVRLAVRVVPKRPARKARAYRVRKGAEETRPNMPEEKPVEAQAEVEKNVLGESAEERKDVEREAASHDLDYDDLYGLPIGKRILAGLKLLGFHPSPDLRAWIGLSLLALAFFLPIVQLIGMNVALSPFSMITEIGSNVGLLNIPDFIVNSQFPFFYMSFLLLPIAIVLCLVGLLFDKNDLRLLAALIGATYPVSFFQIVPAAMIFSIPLMISSLGVYIGISGSLVLVYTGLSGKLSPAFWKVLAVAVVIIAVIYFNPASVSKPAVTNGNLRYNITWSECPSISNLMRMVTDSANESSTVTTGRLSLPYGDVSLYFGSNDTVTNDYKLGYVSSCSNGKCACSFPVEYQSDGRTSTYDLQCRKGELEGENVNYLYCYGFMTDIPGYLIGKYTINPDGTIGRSYRYVVTELVVDSRDYSVKVLECGEVGCYGG